MPFLSANGNGTPTQLSNHLNLPRLRMLVVPGSHTSAPPSFIRLAASDAAPRASLSLSASLSGGCCSCGDGNRIDGGVGRCVLVVSRFSHRQRSNRNSVSPKFNTQTENALIPASPEFPSFREELNSGRRESVCMRTHRRTQTAHRDRSHHLLHPSHRLYQVTVK